MEYFKPAKRYNSANYDREKYCFGYIYDRLDLDNTNWRFHNNDFEMFDLLEIAERIARLMRYNARILINGEPKTIVEFWDVVKHIEYDPGLAGMLRRYEGTERVQWPIKPIVTDVLLNAIYNRVNRTMDKTPGHKPARKFPTQNLILTEEEKREYEAMKAQHKAKAEARAARQQKKGGKV